MVGEIRVGTSGWHYPTGAGTWNGVFYPKPRSKGFDELSHYAQFFNTVEVNSTFYGQPKPEVCAQWVQRTPPYFDFAVKVFQQFTHPKMFRERVTLTLARSLDVTPQELPEDAIAALVNANQADIDTFHRGIEPLASAGKLGALLAQFPASFRDTAENRVHLAALLRALHPYPVAIELRHRSWSDHEADTRALLEAFHATWAWIDEPKFRDSVQQTAIATLPFAYLRLHGRNAKEWWHHTDRDARYNYLYTAQEVDALADHVTEAAPRRARVYFNNHPNARSVTNAAQFNARLGHEMEPLPVTMRGVQTHADHAVP